MIKPTVRNLSLVKQHTHCRTRAHTNVKCNVNHVDPKAVTSPDGSYYAGGFMAGEEEADFYLKTKEKNEYGT